MNICPGCGLDFGHCTDAVDLQERGAEAGDFHGAIVGQENLLQFFREIQRFQLRGAGNLNQTPGVEVMHSLEVKDSYTL